MFTLIGEKKSLSGSPALETGFLSKNDHDLICLWLLFYIGKSMFGEMKCNGNGSGGIVIGA